MFVDPEIVRDGRETQFPPLGLIPGPGTGGSEGASGGLPNLIKRIYCYIRQNFSRL